MMKLEPTTELLRSMNRVVVPASSEQDRLAQRERIKRLLEQRIADEARRASLGRRVRSWSARFAVAAAAVLVAGGSWTMFATSDAPAAAADGERVALHVVRGALNLQRAQESALAQTGHFEVTPSDRVSSGEQQAEFELAGGTRVALEVKTALRVDRALDALGTVDRIVLERGRVELAVPKLEAGSVVRVQTPHAEVTVRGTRFSVSTSELPGQIGLVTTVSVQHGSVEVVHGSGRVLLGGGGVWSSSSGAPSGVEAGSQVAKQESASTRPAGGAERRSAAAAAPRPAGAEPAAAGEDEVSTALAEQNRLFHAAMEAKRRGMYRLAIQRLDALLDRHPRSPLVTDARLERRNLERHLQDVEPAR